MNSLCEPAMQARASAQQINSIDVLERTCVGTQNRQETNTIHLVPVAGDVTGETILGVLAHYWPIHSKQLGDHWLRHYQCDN